MRHYLMAFAIAMACSANAAAQELPSYKTTGTLTVQIDGKSKEYRTSSNTVPNQSGRLVNTANWRIMKPLKMGGQSIGPEGVFISMLASENVPPKYSDATVKITFLLDEVTHALNSYPFEVIYVTDKASGESEYRYQDGQLEITSVTPAEGDALDIKGLSSGTLASMPKNSKDKSETTHKPYRVEFQVRAYPLNAKK